MAMTINTTANDNKAPVSPVSETAAPATAAATSPDSDDNDNSPKSPISSTSSNINTANNIKRKPSRRANTAERRATHNAVERQRRETLNSRFLDLAALLPNLSQIRRPSKSSIVNSSIAHIHASRRHRMLASRELRLLKAESDALRRELNEWRDRAGLPRVEEPMRSEGFAVVVNGEMDAMMVSAEMGAHHGMGGHLGAMEEELEDGDDDWGMNGGGNSSYPQGEDDMIAPPQSSGGYNMPPQAFPPPHPPQSGYMGGPHPQGPYGHHMQAFLDDEGRGNAASAKGGPNGGSGNPFAHNIPRGSTLVPYGEGAAGGLFTPPMSRDGPIPIGPVVHHQQQGGSSAGGSSISGGASPTHSVHSQGQQRSIAGSPDGHARSMSGSPVGFVPQGQPQRRGSGSPSYELGYSQQQQQQYVAQQQHQQQAQHNGSLGGMMHGYGAHHHAGLNGLGGHAGMPGMGGMALGGYGPHGHGPQHNSPMVGVGAGAMGGVFGMML